VFPEVLKIDNMIIIGLLVLFTLFFVYYSKYQFVNNKKWHKYGFLMRITVFLLGIMQLPWNQVAFVGVLLVILWEIGINKIALNKPWDYIGSTAWTDIQYGKYKWHLMGIALIISTIMLFL
tara:strand:+ start:248 stop:610 length:363 start_codon:yes stop_codon:yes gene_type:complete